MKLYEYRLGWGCSNKIQCIEHDNVRETNKMYILENSYSDKIHKDKIEREDNYGCVYLLEKDINKAIDIFLEKIQRQVDKLNKQIEDLNNQRES